MVQGVAIFDCEGSGSDELSFKVDDVIVNLKPAPTVKGWYVGTLRGTAKSGLVPGNYIRLQESPPPPLWRIHLDPIPPSGSSTSGGNKNANPTNKTALLSNSNQGSSPKLESLEAQVLSKRALAPIHAQSTALPEISSPSTVAPAEKSASGQNLTTVNAGGGIDSAAKVTTYRVTRKVALLESITPSGPLSTDTPSGGASN